MSAELRLWHGGAPGLRVGDIIEPRSTSDAAHLIDGCPTCEARRDGSPLADDDLDPSKVYVTTDREYARIYAAGYPNGALYRVEAIGDLTPSPDPVPSWGCSSARVLAVYDRRVSLTPREIRRVTREYA